MLNKQGKGKIDWCDYSFNPISGRCLHNCSYCYMDRFWRLGGNAKLQIKEKYFNANLDKKKPSKIFIGSSTDMWGDWVSTGWIQRVLDFVKANPKHIFQFLTKNPRRYSNFNLPKNAWYGTTVDGTYNTNENMRALNLSVCRSDSEEGKRFISFEPLIKIPDIYLLNRFDWVIIGADSSRGAKKPPKEWADKIINKAKYFGIPVFIKDNYNYPEIVKEFPNE